MSSVRALVFRDESILLMHNVDGPHIIPGGRVESGESHLDALRRELIEEAGVEITGVRPLGFMHLRHETPKPPNYPYLYPDFFWPIFVKRNTTAKARRHRVQDDYELSSEFVPIIDLDRSALTAGETGLSRSRSLQTREDSNVTMLSIVAKLPSEPTGKPPVIFVHGAGTSAPVWTYWQAAFVEAGWPTYNLDLRGHGAE